MLFQKFNWLHNDTCGFSVKSARILIHTILQTGETEDAKVPVLILIYIYGSMGLKCT